MNRILLILSLFFAVPIGVFAQAYTFELGQGTYTDLVDPISITNDLTWDDPEFAIPIGFDFQLFETMTDSFFIEGSVTGLYSSSNWQESRAAIFSYDLDFVDRAFDINGEEGQPGGISPISYKVSGNIGSRIFKMEWKNIGTYEGLDVNGNSSTDFANFQLWLYEGSNNIEFHVGASSLAELIQIYSGYGDEFGIYIGIDPFYSENWGVSPEALGIVGDPSNPTFGNWTQLDEEALTAQIPDGTIYRFIKNDATATNDLIKESNLIQIFPNPITETFQIKKSVADLQIQSIQILHVNGKIMRTLNESTEVNIADLSPGCYFVQFSTDQGILTKRIIKM